MQRIGREVLFLETGKGNPRNGEGSFLRLRDGRVMLAYTEYYGDNWEDHCTARLSAVYSADEGETWSAPAILLERDEKAENYMSVSLVRLPDGGLGMIYLRKEIAADGEISCVPYFRRSDDEGASFSEAVCCVPCEGYYCGINDGAIVQRNGRILMPMSEHRAIFRERGHEDDASSNVVIACSDDNGRTWSLLPQVLHSPYPNKKGLAEPGIYEHESGELWLWARTVYGHQYESRSVDGGKTWSPMIPNHYFTSPDAPMRVKRVGDYTVAVFNPYGYNCMRTDYSDRGSVLRIPLVLAASTDDGASFAPAYISGMSLKGIAFAESCYLLEDDPTSRYCYPSICEVEGGFLVAYYHSNGGTYTLNCTKLVKVTFEELTERKNLFFTS